MPSSQNGIGTTWYGYREEHRDGSYVTTEFVILFDIPLWPTGSYRVRPIGEPERGSRGIFHRRSWKRQSFDVTPIPLHWRQVFNVYFAAVCIFGGPFAIYFAWPFLMEGYAAVERMINPPACVVCTR